MMLVSFGLAAVLWGVVVAVGPGAWINSVTTIGGPNDQGFTEQEVSNVVERYGDVAHVFSTYQKRFWGGEEILGRGINSFQLVHGGGRWWIVGIVWDEEVGAGPIPEKYLD